MTFIEPFSILLALLPLIAYLGVLSAIRLSGRALVTTAGRDAAALGMAISGLVAVGPIELFFPNAAAMMFGPAVWLALAAFYGLSVTLVALSLAPKLIVYGRTPAEVYEPLLAAASEIDPAASGEAGTLQVVLPSVGVRLRVDGHRAVDHAQVVAFESNISMKFWQQLLASLRKHLHHQPAAMPRHGFGTLIAALLLSFILIWQSFGNHELVVEGFRQWLWR